MKIIKKFIIFFLIVKVFTQTISDDTESCKNELNHYQDCLNSILKINNSTTEYNNSIINDICSIFFENQCKYFVDDVLLTKTDCIKETLPNDNDLEAGFSILNSRVIYLTFCALDHLGNSCPLPQYFRQHFDELEKNVNSTTNVFVALETDCKDKSCNQRISHYEKLVQSVDNIRSNLTTSTQENSSLLGLPQHVIALYEQYIHNYKFNLCGAIEEYVDDNDAIKNYLFSNTIFLIILSVFTIIFIL